MPILNNTVLDIWNFLREQILNVLSIYKWQLYDVMEVLTNPIVVIISHYVSVSDHHITPVLT